IDRRVVRNSGGQTEKRPVIRTTVTAGEYQWPIELTLTNRDEMGFRMLLGREAVRRRFLVDSGQSYLQSTLPTPRLKGSKKKLKGRKKKTYGQKITKKITKK
ncbi:MAG: RimK/LysX family protein, partial [Cyanobacteria bacterium J06631_9]